DHGQPGMGVRHRGRDRNAGSREEGRRGAVDRRSVLGLLESGEGLERRLAGVRPARPESSVQDGLQCRAGGSGGGEMSLGNWELGIGKWELPFLMGVALFPLQLEAQTAVSAG